MRLNILLTICILIFFGSLTYGFQQKGKSLTNDDFETTKSTPTATGAATGATEKTANPTTGESNWRSTLAGATIPNGAAKGQIYGQQFLAENGKIEDGILKLYQGKGDLPDLQVTLSLNFFLVNKQLPFGKTFRVPEDNNGVLFSVCTSSIKPGRSISNCGIAISSMILELGQPNNKKLPVKIYLNLKDDAKSYVAGTFEAEIK